MTKGINGYTNTRTPIRIPVIPERIFHPGFSLSTSSGMIERTAHKSQNIPSTCTSLIVVNTGEDNRNIPIVTSVIVAINTSLHLIEQLHYLAS
jgi:hypothetical protein